MIFCAYLCDLLLHRGHRSHGNTLCSEAMSLGLEALNSALSCAEAIGNGFSAENIREKVCFLGCKEAPVCRRTGVI